MSQDQEFARFARCVHETVSLVPRGKVTSYGRIAKACGRPRGAREVGWVVNAGDDVERPYHRVVNQAGELTGDWAFENNHVMRARLEAEGVAFLLDGRVDMKQWAWEPGEEAVQGDGYMPLDLDLKW